jgi:hydrogenase nickel incorporation protein HypA/HybF
MHELALAQALLEQVVELARSHGTTRVTRVRVRIGPFSGVVRDSFSFGFECLKGEWPETAQARLEVHAPVPRWRCCSCGQETEGMEEASPWTAACPFCGTAGLAPHGGDDLILQEVELE